jgi:hypothetical protein
MPAVIKSKRAQVTDEARDWAISFWKASYRKIRRIIDTAPLLQQESLEYQYGVALDRIWSIGHDPTALDYEITRLRATPYTLLERKVVNTRHSKTPVDYLVAHTKTIVIDDHGPFDMGPYTVYIPLSIVNDGPGTHLLHMVPERAPKTWARHPHHKLSEGGDVSGEPWDYASHTCWGDFGPIMIRIVNEGDLVDLLRNIAIYLSRYNEGSPLTRIASCSHRVSISRAQATELKKNG